MSEQKEFISCTEKQGTIHISEDVVAVIAAAAAKEIEGVSGLSADLGSEVAEMFGKKSLSKGVIIVVEGDCVRVEISIIVTYGYEIQKVAREVQEAVCNSIESMSGLEVTAVNVTVGGISFDKK